MGTSQSHEKPTSTIRPDAGNGNLSDSNEPRIVFVPRERFRDGVVHAKISSVNVASGRENDSNQRDVVVSPRGMIFFGNNSPPHPVSRAISQARVPMMSPAECALGDSRAHKLLVIHTNNWYVVPSQEPFSRHSGTCLIIGDKRFSNGPYKIKLGDCFRLGSVGVVVSEIKADVNGEEQRLDNKKLQFLKDEAYAFDVDEEVAILASEEQANANKKKNISSDENDVAEESVDRPDTPSSVYSNKTSNVSPERENSRCIDTTDDFGTGGIANGERFICYMCYETHDTPSDPLVAPCDCKGDTRYLHVQCLQKWYQSSVTGPQARVIRSTSTGAPACKICGSAYKTTFRKPDGKLANLLETECPGPYISFVVVTRHDTNPSLFNTKFRLNFGAMTDSAQDFVGFSNSLLIGRSSTCNMVLDYRTVSTVHAKVTFEDGEFYIQDRDSSNGTMVYLQRPLKLKYSSPVRIRMGRTTMQLLAKRSWSAALRSAIATSFPALLNSYDRNDYVAADAITADGKIIGGTNHRHLKDSATLSNIADACNGSVSNERLVSANHISLNHVDFPRVLTEDELLNLMIEYPSPPLLNGNVTSHIITSQFVDLSSLYRVQANLLPDNPSDMPQNSAHFSPINTDSVVKEFQDVSSPTRSNVSPSKLARSLKSSGARSPDSESPTSKANGENPLSRSRRNSGYSPGLSRSNSSHIPRTTEEKSRKGSLRSPMSRSSSLKEISSSRINSSIRSRSGSPANIKVSPRSMDAPVKSFNDEEIIEANIDITTTVSSSQPNRGLEASMRSSFSKSGRDLLHLESTDTVLDNTIRPGSTLVIRNNFDDLPVLADGSILDSIESGISPVASQVINQNCRNHNSPNEFDGAVTLPTAGVYSTSRPNSGSTSERSKYSNSQPSSLQFEEST